MKILREVTVWDKVDYDVPNHDYLVTDTKEFVYAYRKHGTQDWEQFAKRRSFTKTYRKFKELKKEAIPTEFIKPFTTDPRSYQSLEFFFGENA